MAKSPTTRRWRGRAAWVTAAVACFGVAAGVAFGLRGEGGPGLCRSGADPRPAEAPAPGPVTGKPSESAGLWVVNLDGSEARRVTAPVAPMWLGDQIQWLPGSPGSPGDLAYLADGGDLVFVTPDGAPSRTALPQAGFHSSVSPDGARVAVVASGLATSGLDGGGRLQLTTFDGTGSDTVTYPAWSPDGRQLVFSADSMPTSSTERLEVINADGSDRRVLIQQHGPRLQHASWSPDGARIVFSALGGYYGSWIGVIRPDGSGYQRIARHCSGTSPEWSPDGARIAFSDNYSLVIMDSDGTDMRRVPNTWDGHTPAWSPDGHRVAFLRY